MNRVSNLILDAREETKNTDSTDTSGIADSIFLRHLNDAQTRIFSLITHSHPHVFDKTVELPMISGIASYNIPVDCFMDNKVSDVKYSIEAIRESWQQVYLSTIKQDVTRVAAQPVEYYRQSGKIVLMPPPQNGGTLRLTYTQKMPKMDLPRATVLSVTLDPTTKTITDLTLDPNLPLDSTILNRDNKLTIVDEDGNITMSAIKFTDINTASGVVTVSPSFTYQEGETIIVGSSVVSGPYSSTHFQMNDYVERYLVTYTSMMIMKREFSQEMPNQNAILASMEEEIVGSYAAIVSDTQEIPMIISNDEQWS